MRPARAKRSGLMARAARPDRPQLCGNRGVRWCRGADGAGHQAERDHTAMNEVISAAVNWRPDTQQIPDAEPGKGLEALADKNELWQRRRNLAFYYNSDLQEATRREALRRPDAPEPRAATALVAPHYRRRRRPSSPQRTSRRRGESPSAR